MAVKLYTATVDTTPKTLATLTVTVANMVLARIDQPVTVKIQVPTGGQAVFIGDSTVTSGNGYSIAVGATELFKFRNIDELNGLFLVVAGTTQAVRILSYLGE